MNRRILQPALATLLLAGAGACNPLSVDEVIDPNNPTLEGVSQNASRGELNNLVFGLESVQRGTFTSVVTAFGSFGRELWYLQTDPRFLADLLGQNGLTPYPDHFGTGGTYNTPFGAVKQANLLIQAVENTTAVSPTEASGYIGFAKTIQGLQLLTPLNGQYQNGIRIDVAEPLNPGPILGYDEALAGIRQILDEGASDLASAGSSLAFELTDGFAGFRTPQGLRQINRAVAARAAVYARDWTGALSALEESFFDLDGDLDMGPRAIYGSPPDIFNPLFFPHNTGSQPLIAVHPSLIEDALPGDRRVAAKFAERSTPFSHAALEVDATHQPAIWPTPESPVPIIRNEELILIYAEAQAQLGNADEAIRAIDRIRTAWGLQPYDGATDTASLIDEILFQRRYSLWGEGHRWIDARRYDRLDEIPVDLDNGTVFTQLARPSSETNWEDSQGGG